MKNLIYKLETLIQNILNKTQSNKSIFYYCIVAISVFGLLFFISSKNIFDKDNKDIRSTNLNEFQTNDTLKAKILSRKYSSLSKMVEFIIYVEDANQLNSDNLVIELREQQAPNLKIENRYQIVNKNYYVVFAKVPKNWKVLSLALGYKDDLYNPELDAIYIENDEESEEEKEREIEEKEREIEENNPPLKSVVRIYSDINDIKHESLMKEKRNIEYFSEIMNLEISFIKKEIENLNEKLEKYNSTTKETEQKIIDLKSDIKYKTESEKIATDTDISKLKNTITTINDLADKDIEMIKELEEKIVKLEQKRKDFTG